MYDVSVHPLADRVLKHIRSTALLSPGDRVGVAVSGGIDSVALLRLLLEIRNELGIVFSVVHFNHRLRGAESDADQQFVAGLARQHRLEFYTESGDAAKLASEEHSGLEAAARELRYEFFGKLLGADDLDSHQPPDVSQLDKIATGHTLDDQAETVLMRVIRGTGTRGLAAIYPRIAVEDADGELVGEIVRPLLEIRRRAIEHYLKEINQPWREDVTNVDGRFTRNRLRKDLFPLIEREFNPSVTKNLSELAEIARDEEDYWQNEVSGWLGTVVQWSPPEWARSSEGPEPQSLVQISLPDQTRASRTLGLQTGDLQNETDLESLPDDRVIANATLSRPWLLSEPKAVQRRVVKAIGEHACIPLQFEHVQEILRFAAEDGPSEKELSLPLGWKLVREPEAMVFVAPDPRHENPAPDYEYRLEVPGRVQVAELGVLIEALRLTPDLAKAEYNAQQLLDAKLLRPVLRVRNWRPGDRFWPAHTKAPKKIKELLHERHKPQSERKLWPVAISGEEVVWIRDFRLPAKFQWRGDGEAVKIREIRANEDDEI